MIKKLLLFVAIICAAAANAQTGSGSWYLYSSFVDFEDLVETPSKVFYLSNGSLYSYDKSTDEHYTYSSNNLLHDNNISKIEYNPLGKYLAVIYSNSNIDLVHESGEVTNLSDIKDAVLNVSPIINAVAFSKGQMAVATNFGVVLFDDKKGEVIESGIYNINIPAIAMNDTRLFIYYQVDNNWSWRTIEKSRHINLLDKFQDIDVIWLQQMYADNKYIYTFANDNTTNVKVYELVEKTGSTRFGLNMVNQVSGVRPRVNFLNGNKSYFYNDNNIYVLDENAQTTATQLPSQLKGMMVAMYDRPTLLWGAKTDGLGRYDFADGSVTVKNDSFLPVALNVSKIGHIVPMIEGGVMAFPRSNSGDFLDDWPDNSRKINFNYVNGSEVVPYDLAHSGIKSNENITSYRQCPSDPSYEFMGTDRFGMYRLKDGVCDFTFTKDNSAISGTGTWIYSSPQALDFDRHGNLFVACWNLSTDDSKYGRIVMLPANKVTASNPVMDDWVTILRQNKLSNANHGRDGVLLAAKKSDLVLHSFFNSKLLAVINTHGTVSNADDDIEVYDAFVDQDSRSTSITSRTMVFAEDKNGDIWIACENGVFIIYNPQKLNGAQTTFYKVKVPRNDGTNLADYLLEGVTITDITVDSNNNKWFTTKGDGVYYVSEDGRNILQHFTLTNSPLPTNDVYAVGCDVNSNQVYFGTTMGLMRYNSTSAPAAEDLEEVYAYPNPVRPEYRGWIIIKNLMDNTVVKIADASGNVFFNGVSEGGMISWDGCDMTGQRVKTGVYYVFASKSGDSQSAKAVTKILVVN